MRTTKAIPPSTPTVPPSAPAVPAVVAPAPAPAPTAAATQPQFVFFFGLSLSSSAIAKTPSLLELSSSLGAYQLVQSGLVSRVEELHTAPAQVVTERSKLLRVALPLTLLLRDWQRRPQFVQPIVGLA